MSSQLIHTFFQSKRFCNPIPMFLVKFRENPAHLFWAKIRNPNRMNDVAHLSFWNPFWKFSMSNCLKIFGIKQMLYILNLNQITSFYFMKLSINYNRSFRQLVLGEIIFALFMSVLHHIKIYNCCSLQFLFIITFHSFCHFYFIFPSRWLIRIEYCRI